MTGISTNLIHSRDKRVADVTPPINLTTTYEYPEDPNLLVKAVDRSLDDYYYQNNFYYSRISNPSSEILEKALPSLLGGHAIMYNSGLSAFFAALTHYNPKRLIIGQAYHGCIGITKIFARNNGLQILSIDDLSNFELLQKGDLVHLETPVNPQGTNFDIAKLADLAHKKGAYLLVDATFAPPPLQDPFKQNADMVMHSATKFLGGHSDLLAGVLVTKDKTVQSQLLADRICLGTNIGNLESSLLVRSLKTFELRITAQSNNATALVKYLSENLSKFTGLELVLHGSIQDNKDQLLAQISHHSPVFSIVMKTEDLARNLPNKLKYFIHATSLGGVESLIEWRAISDSTLDSRLLRVSVGVENIDDLIGDFSQALS